jgi:hypothetical protein
VSIVERVEQFVNGERGPYEKVTADLRALLALVKAVRDAQTPLAKAAEYLSGADVYAAQLDAIDTALEAVTRGEG